jgi:2-keto-3-deoxy-L-rhamnonate aldolase RhmA
VGFNDLCAEMGIPGQFASEKAGSAFAAVVAACKRAGKYPGMGGVYEPKLMEKFIGMGARFVLSGSDMSFLMAGGRERTAFLRGLKF